MTSTDRAQRCLVCRSSAKPTSSEQEDKITARVHHVRRKNPSFVAAVAPRSWMSRSKPSTPSVKHPPPPLSPPSSPPASSTVISRAEALIAQCEYSAALGLLLSAAKSLSSDA